MSLKSYVQSQIYKGKNNTMPQAYSRFGILIPEDSNCSTTVKSSPLPDNEHLFALLWNTHDGNILSATILPSETAFTFEKGFEVGTRTQLHSHKYLEFFYIVEGEYRQRILGNEFTFHKGEACLIDRNCLHQEILAGTNTTILFLGITNIMFNDIMNRQVHTERIASFFNMALMEQKALQQCLQFYPKNAKSLSEMEESLYSLLQELSRHDFASPYICQGLLLRIFFLLSTQYEFSLSKQLQKKMNFILFEEMTEYMKQNLSHMSLRCLCDKFHFQKDYFNRLLKAQTGLTYTEYLQHLRLQKAQILLSNTDLTVEEIAQAVGYHNKGYFYKIFAKQFQVTPAQFRKNTKL